MTKFAGSKRFGAKMTAWQSYHCFGWVMPVRGYTDERGNPKIMNDKDGIPYVQFAIRVPHGRRDNYFPAAMFGRHADWFVKSIIKHEMCMFIGYWEQKKVMLKSPNPDIERKRDWFDIVVTDIKKLNIQEFKKTKIDIPWEDED